MPVVGALNKMTQDSQELWMALSELRDYFSRLAGSARYPSMTESEIPLYVASLLMQRHKPSFEPGDFIDRRFMEAASPVLDNTRAHIAAVSAEGGLLAELIVEFVLYADSKLMPKDRSSQWNRFADLVNQMSAQQSESEKRHTFEEVMAEVQKNQRVCPQPQKWNQLYEMLPQRRRKGTGWEPSLPLILAAWWDTPALPKMIRLREHVEWAAAHGCLDEIYSFLCDLPEDKWHHIGD